MEKKDYLWTDNPAVSGVSVCDTDILNDCMMHLKYNNSNGLPLFFMLTTDRALLGDEAVGWALQGSYVTMTYPDAVNMIMSEYESGSDTTYRGIACKRSVSGRYIADISKKDDVDELYATTGVADIYLLDKKDNAFFLPKTKWFSQYTTDLSRLNNYNAPGLPNITGRAGTIFQAADTITSGAFTIGTSGWDNKGSTGNSGYSFNFDASRSSSVYGRSSSVQPPSSNKFVYYKVGDVVTGAATALVDAKEFLADSVKDIDKATSDAIAAISSASDAISQNRVTNCIVNAPKRVTCQMDSDGTFRALAGSTFIIPNGFNEDGTRRFDYVTSTRDSVRNPESPLGPNYKALWFQSAGNISSGTISLRLSCNPGTFVTSATQPSTQPGNWKVWYDTKNNVIKMYSGETNTWLNVLLSIPFAMTYCNLPSGTTVKFDFTEMNGVHWFGDTIFVDKDVTVSAPNGRNADGSLKNKIYTTSNVVYNTRAIGNYSGTYSVDYYLHSGGESIASYGSGGSGSFFYGRLAPETYADTGTGHYDSDANLITIGAANSPGRTPLDMAYIGTFYMDKAAGGWMPSNSVGLQSPIATHRDVYRIPSYYGLYSKTYVNGNAGYRLFYYDSAFRNFAFGIQWGYSSGITGTVNLYTPFSNANYHISLAYKASANQGSKCKTPTVLSTTASSFKIGYLDSGSATVVQGVGWVAMGC